MDLAQVTLKDEGKMYLGSVHTLSHSFDDSKNFHFNKPTYCVQLYCFSEH